MAAITRYSVAKTQRSYDPAGVNAVLGSTVFSSTEAWGPSATNKGLTMSYAGPVVGTSRLNPTT